MTEPTPQARERAAFENLMLALWQDAAAGDLEKSRMRLTLHPPYRARQAVMHLGLPYLKKIKALGDSAQLGSLSGTAAIDTYIDQTLKPIVASNPLPPIRAPKKSPPPAVKKYKTSRLRRFVSRIALATALGLGVVTGGYMLTESLKPDPIETPAIDSIAELRTEFSRTNMGRQLLEVADRGGVTIVYDPTLPERKAAAEYSAATKRASVRPDLSPDDQVLYLSHELRHAWQDLELGYGAMEDRLLTPKQQWVVRRFLEADAAAFSTVFLAERMQALYHTEQPQGSGAYFEYTLAKALLREYRSGNGLTLAEYREQVLTSAFANLDSYDDKHLLLATIQIDGLSSRVRMAQFYVENDMFTEADISLRNLKEMISTTPGDDEFETWLRRMGGTSLHAAAQTALQQQSVSRQDMFNQFAKLGQTPPTVYATTETAAALPDKLQHLHAAHALFEAQVELVAKLDALNALKKQQRQQMVQQGNRPKPHATL